jgi:alkylhydroperoxidase family enzyme
MLKTLIHRQIHAQEQRYEMSLAYLHHIAETSRSAVAVLALFLPMARYRRVVPAAAFHVAVLVAVRAQDCGTCVQVGVKMARDDGVTGKVLRAVLQDQPDQLPADLADVYHYARAVVQQQDDAALREQLRDRYGDAGLIDLAYALATAQMFPVLKRALGYATTCARVDLDDASLETTALPV